eukprot:9009387-Pyramimonas_sp.AAC.1
MRGDDQQSTVALRAQIERLTGERDALAAEASAVREEDQRSTAALRAQIERLKGERDALTAE